MAKILFIFVLLGSFEVFAKDKEKIFSSYDEAKKSEEFLRFESESTKFGIITTDFDGYARKFIYRYEISNKIITSGSVTIFVSALDTDSDGRNEKMMGKCLEKEKFPEIKAMLISPLELSEKELTVPLKLTIKDKTIEKNFEVKLTQTPNGFVFEGKGSFSLKEFDIPDPSIAIAHVRDQFDLSFKFLLD